MRADPWSTTKAQAVFESSEINFYSFLHYNCLRLRPHCGGGNWKGSFHSENVWNVFRLHFARGTITGHFRFVWGKLGPRGDSVRPGKSYDCHDAIVSHENEKPMFSNSLGLQSVLHPTKRIILLKYKTERINTTGLSEKEMSTPRH